LVQFLKILALLCMNFFEVTSQPGLQTYRKNDTALAPELFFSWLQLLFVFKNKYFHCFVVPHVEWKMNHIKYTKLREYTKSF